ncbi:topology modulation protein [Alicyclobacillus contaminans]|uniref:DNA topology modulation protein n=1 Tax=Alicyclobacillus contaminans TaxID=392016 RepID=UPI000420BB24|nr:DNA topology modulation protein [Alicyclobacillus contaminans]GMA52246.1 topology modulation protein [Alicyclobacillus contaminans]
MQRVAIIGAPGAGKSTFAQRLGAITGIQVFHLDRLFWKPGWVETPRDEWITLQERLVQNEAWIIDGNYGATMDIRVQAADTVIHLDFPRRVCLWRIVKRWIRYRGRTRPDMAQGCPEKMDWAFFRYTWAFRRREQAAIVQRLEEAARQGKQVVSLCTVSQVNAYLSAVQGGDCSRSGGRGID